MKNDASEKKRIIALDFDGCLVENEYPKIGKLNRHVLTSVLREKELGSKIILWTCREGKELSYAKEYCKGLKLEFDAINENIPEIQESFGYDCRKVVATEYWDDRAVRMGKI